MLAKLCNCLYINYLLLLFVVTLIRPSTEDVVHSQYVYQDADGRLQYAHYNEEGDTIVDFSYAGYHNGDVEIPNDVPTVKVVGPLGNGESDVFNIQQAIEEVSQLPIDNSTGFRGAILLEAGDTIVVNVSGIIIRGAGMDKTVLYGSAAKPYNLIQLGKSNNIQTTYLTRPMNLTGYIPVGTKEINITNAKRLFKVGDTLAILSSKNQLFINKTGMNLIKFYAKKNKVTDPTVRNWVPFDSRTDRTVVEVKDGSVVIDVPLVEAIDPRYGGGAIRRITFEKLVDHVGLEDLCSYSYFDESVTQNYTDKKKTRYYSDEKHAERLVVFYGVHDGFARRICGRHFIHFLHVHQNSRRITVEDASHFDPVSIITGSRRYQFLIQKSSEVLVKNCYSRGARHAFTFSLYTTGPNVYYNCTSEADYGFSEPHQLWAVGGLYDNAHGPISIINHLYYGGNHGWPAANFVAWNTEGQLMLESPVTHWNFAIGHVGVKMNPNFSHARGASNRSWEHFGTHVEPQSLYNAQLEDRHRGQQYNEEYNYDYGWNAK